MSNGSGGRSVCNDGTITVMEIVGLMVSGYYKPIVLNKMEVDRNYVSVCYLTIDPHVCLVFDHLISISLLWWG